MKHTRFSHKIMALTLFLAFLPSLIPINYVFASNNGPNAPEAASFEPVDATDMVNLATGDMTYTMPLLNVPSPEGGFPLALAYHAGIAVDQDASWVGLGWSLNPGAINRTINGYPDDWNNVKTYEYYWNEAEINRQHTIDVSIPLSGVTIGLGASWGSSRGFSGSIGLTVLGTKDFGGLGIHTSTDGSASIGAGTISGIGANIAMSQNGLAYGAGYQKNGASLGLQYLNQAGLVGSVGIAGDKVGLSVNTNGQVGYGLGASIQVKDDNGNRIGTARANSGGTAYNTTMTQGDVTIDQKSFTIPLVVINYRYERVKWWVDTLKEVGVSGALYADSDILNVAQSVIDYCEQNYGRCYPYLGNSQSCNCIEANGIGYGYTGTQTNPDYSFSDIQEINYNGDSERFSILNRNPAMVNFDGYNVATQGIGGSMRPRFFKSISLVNVNHDFEEADLQYYRHEDGQDPVTPKFYFDDEISGGALVNNVTHLNATNPNGFEDYISEPAQAFTGNKRSGNYVEYYTYGSIPADAMMPPSFLRPTGVEDDAIAGFKITSTDGIVYHFSLPVYNLMDKFRYFNYQDDEKEAYFERTNGAYATHWLLTAITGPDYIDSNTNGVLDEQDTGYWVDFDYGKWSDGFTWRSPSSLDEYQEIKGNKIYRWGVKQLYYLDQIKTRTHTAIFVKDIRTDSFGVPQRFIHQDNSQDPVLPSQKQLKLSKIVIVPRSKLGTVVKQNQTHLTSLPDRTYSFFDPELGITHQFSLNHENNVIDIGDSFTRSLDGKALNVIDFDYDYQLAPNSPNTDSGGKLTLTSVHTRGKTGASVMPPYRFEYGNNPTWDYEDRNYWGYVQKNAPAWSLTRIVTPIGTDINVGYEGDIYKNYENNTTYGFKEVNDNAQPSSLTMTVDVGNYEFGDGDRIYLSYDKRLFDCYDNKLYRATYEGEVELEQSTAHNSRYSIRLIQPNDYTYVQESTFQTCPTQTELGGYTFSKIPGTPYVQRGGAGIRVSHVDVVDEMGETLRNSYEYGVGSVPYEPYFDDQGVRDQSLLRAPNVLYDKVVIRNLDTNGNVIDNLRTEYEFITDSDNYNNIFQKLQSNPSQTLLDNGFNGNVSRSDSYDYQDYQGIVGNLSRIAIYQNNMLRSETKNQYAFLDETSGFLNRESTQMYKTVNPKPGNDNYININRLITTNYTRYPVVLQSSTVTSGGFTQTEVYGERDINTGQILSSTTTNSKGESIRSVNVPAYVQYPVMGSKEDDIDNRHMLAQGALSYTEMDKGNGYKKLDASIISWKSWENGIWRKHGTYTWNGTRDNQGFLDNYQGEDDGFDWVDATNNDNTDWKKLTKIGRYNHFSMPLEIIDVNNNKSSTKKSNNHLKTIASGNAGYDELFYSGAEDLDGSDFGGEVGLGTAAPEDNLANVHTGGHALAIASGQTGYVVSVTEGNSDQYKVSLWAKYGTHTDTRIQVGNASPISYKDNEWVRAGDWVQLNFYFDITGTQEVRVISAGQTVYVDDFRLHPVSSSLSSYVYNEWDELSHILGPNNMAVEYRYDQMGRLEETLTEVADFEGPGSGGFKKTSAHEYTYKY